MAMRVSTRRLLQGVFDFAGIFPPARLSMEDSVARYLSATAGPEAWLLGRFVCSSSRLGELAAVLERVTDPPTIQISVLGQGNEDRPSWEAALEHDSRAMNAFHQRIGSRAEILGYEVRVPVSTDMARYVRDLAGFSEAEVFVELPVSREQEDILVVLAESEWIGAKIRAGGLTPNAAPEPGGVARFIRSCLDLELNFKMTAGLHRALTHRDPGTDAHSFGFINVLSATVLGLSDDLSAKEIESILLDADKASWSFDDRGIDWKDHQAGLATIEEARLFFNSIGSCSIDEPLRELEDLHL